MKKLVKLTLVVLFTISGLSILNAENKNKMTKEFKVLGNCAMCETRIETAAYSVDGVTMADWNKETKMLTVTYNPRKAEVMDIHMAVAKMGHDTDKMKANTEAYDQFADCCKYHRENIQMAK